MAITETIMGFVLNFALYGGGAFMLILLLGAVSYPVWIRKLYPIPFILLKNSGGASDNRGITLHSKIVRWGRLKKTEYGPRVKIRGVPNTVPLNVLSRDNAIPWERGGIAFMIYEKEVNQFFPVTPKPLGLDLLMGKKKGETQEIKKIYADLQVMYPELAHNFRMVTPKSIIAPVSFCNASVKLRPFPIDAITPFAYDMSIRQQRAHKKNWMEKYGFMAVALVTIVLIIVVAVLSFEQTNKSIDDRLVQLTTGSNNIAEKIAQKLAPAETAPGAAPIFLPLLPFLFRRRRPG